MLTGIAAGVAAGALWGLVFVAPSMARGFPPTDLTAGRFIVYGAMALGMLLWTLRGTPRWPTLRQAGAALGLSILGFTGYYFLLVLAIRDAGTEMPRSSSARFRCGSCCWASRMGCVGRRWCPGCCSPSPGWC